MCPYKNLFQFLFFVKTQAPSSSVGHAAVLWIVRSGVAIHHSTDDRLFCFSAAFPLCSHALCISVTHSSHLYKNFSFLYLLGRPALGSLLDYISLVRIDVRLRHLSVPSDLPRWAKHQYASGVAGGALAFLTMWAISGSFWARIT